MHGLIFRLPGPESAQNAENIARTARVAGIATTIVRYWEDDWRGDLEEQNLLNGRGLDTVGRISAHAFGRQGGYRLDFADLSAHAIASGDFRTDTILSESVWNQKLRQVALHADALISRLAPDIVFVPHGAEVISRLLAIAASRRGCRVCYWESPFFPGFHFIDPVGPHFYRGDCHIDRVLATPFSDTDREVGATFIDSVRRDGLTKYRQSTEPQVLDDLGHWRRSDERPVVLIAGQLSHDANVVVSLSDQANYQALCRTAVASIGSQWRVVFKPHPFDRAPEGWQAVLGEHVHIVRSAAIHDLFGLCDAVAVHSSNVGLEALMAGLPVVVSGTPVYGGHGLTVDLAHPGALGAALQDLRPPSTEQLHGFVGRLIGAGLVRQDDGEQLRQVTDIATDRMPPARAGWYGAPVQRLIAAAQALDATVDLHHPMAEALGRIAPADAALLATTFGNDLAGHRFGGPITDGTPPARYDLAGIFASLHPGGPVVFDEADILNARDPGGEIARLYRQVPANGGIAFRLPAPGTDASAIQALTFQDVKTLLDEAGIRHIGIGIRNATVCDDTGGEAIFILQGPEWQQALDVRDLTGKQLSFRLAAAEFRCDAPTEQLPDGLSFPLAAPPRHILYGATVDLPAGRWRALFDLAISTKTSLLDRWRDRNPVRLTLDIFQPETQDVTTRDYTVPARAFGIEFRTQAHSRCELRVFSHVVAGEARATLRSVLIEPLQ